MVQFPPVVLPGPRAGKHSEGLLRKHVLNNVSIEIKKTPIKQ